MQLPLIVEETPSETQDTTSIETISTETTSIETTSTENQDKEVIIV